MQRAGFHKGLMFEMNFLFLTETKTNIGIFVKWKLHTRASGVWSQSRFCIFVLFCLSPPSSLEKSKASKKDEIAGMRREWEQNHKIFYSYFAYQKYSPQIFSWEQFDCIFYLLVESFACARQSPFPKVWELKYKMCSQSPRELFFSLLNTLCPWVLMIHQIYIKKGFPELWLAASLVPNLSLQVLECA